MYKFIIYTISLFICFISANYLILLANYFDISLQVNWRTVIWGLTLQLIFAIAILRWDFGYNAFKWIGDRVATFLKFTEYGNVECFLLLFTNIHVSLF